MRTMIGISIVLTAAASVLLTLAFTRNDDVLLKDATERELVQMHVDRAVAYYEANGLDATLARGNNPLYNAQYVSISRLSESGMEYEILAHPRQELVGTVQDNTMVHDCATGDPLPEDPAFRAAAASGVWSPPYCFTGVTAPKHAWNVLVDGNLLFSSGYHE